jgi:hypothetical protein
MNAGLEEIEAAVDVFQEKLNKMVANRENSEA